MKDLSETVLCACGCGQRRSKWRSKKPGDYRVARFIKGHTNKGKKLSESHKANIGKANAGHKMTKAQRQLLSKIHKARFAAGAVHPWKGKVNVAMVQGRKKWLKSYKPKNLAERKNGGRYQRQDGYIVIYDKERRCRVLEHRYVMEKYLGRRLKRQESIHHIDGDKANNDINNLMLFPTKSAHTLFHAHSGYPSCS